MIREATAAEVNALINDPAIRPTVGGEGYLDCSDLVANPRNICLYSPGGGALFVWCAPRVYEGHSFFLARGRDAIKLGLAMLAEMDGIADLIWGATPEVLKQARWFNRKIGFASLGFADTASGRCELFEKRFGLCQ